MTTGPPVHIRELGAGEHDRLAQVCTVVSSGFSPVVPVADGAAAFLDDPASFALGAFAGEVPVGLAWGVQMRPPSGRLTTYLHELEVVPARRREGIGRALVLRAMDLARDRGSRRFWLSTGGDNRAAQALYEAAGGERKAEGDVNYWWLLT